MKIQVWSDLHNEFSLFSPLPSDVDLVILAGDIDTRCKGVAWANETFQQPTLYVCGNHEFYGGHIDRTLAKMRQAAKPHVHVLENQSFEFQGTRFLCCTGWTDFSATGDVLAATAVARDWMNDFRSIRASDSYRRLRPADVIERNAASYEFLTRELDKPFAGKTVVVTHHCPAMEVAGDKLDGHLAAAYTNSWHSLLAKANVWVFGHTHRAVDEELSGCRVVSNPRGYPGEETGFSAFLEIEI